MRMYVEVLGVGHRKEGVSRKGNKYDFTEVSIAYEHRDMTGRCAETVAIDTAILGDRKLEPGEVLDVVMHQSNFKTYVDAIL